jgi:hypothetical protein
VQTLSFVVVRLTKPKVVELARFASESDAELWAEKQSGRVAIRRVCACGQVVDPALAVDGPLASGRVVYCGWTCPSLPVPAKYVYPSLPSYPSQPQYPWFGVQRYGTTTGHGLGNAGVITLGGTAQLGGTFNRALASSNIASGYVSVDTPAADLQG